jgi:hypothetical protein
MGTCCAEHQQDNVIPTGWHSRATIDTCTGMQVQVRIPESLSL